MLDHQRNDLNKLLAFEFDACIYTNDKLSCGSQTFVCMKIMRTDVYVYDKLYIQERKTWLFDRMHLTCAIGRFQSEVASCPDPVQV